MARPPKLPDLICVNGLEDSHDMVKSFNGQGMHYASNGVNPPSQYAMASTFPRPLGDPVRISLTAQPNFGQFHTGLPHAPGTQRYGRPNNFNIGDSRSSYTQHRPAINNRRYDLPFDVGLPLIDTYTAMDGSTYLFVKPSRYAGMRFESPFDPPGLTGSFPTRVLPGTTKSLNNCGCNENDDAPEDYESSVDGEGSVDDEGADSSENFNRDPLMAKLGHGLKEFKRLEKEKSKGPSGRQGAPIPVRTGSVAKRVFWRSPKNDKTIPKTHAEKALVAGRLIRDMQNNRECREATTGNIWKKRWADGATYYKPYHFVSLAWELTNQMVEIHEIGWTIPIYDMKHRQLVHRTMYLTFEERFRCLTELLRVSKFTVMSLMKGERMDSVVGNPFEVITRTKINASTNLPRGEVLKAVTAARRSYQASRNDPANNGGPSKAKTTAPTNKRRFRDTDQVEDTDQGTGYTRGGKRIRLSDY